MTNSVIDNEKLEEERTKKKGTKITAIVILGIVFALAIFILVSSFATVELDPNFVAKPDIIHVYKSGHTVSSGIITEETVDSDGNKLYDDFMKYYDNMFNSSFLSALFNGRLSGYSISEAKTSKSVTSLIGGFENDYVRFSYDDQITLAHKNGAEIKSKKDSSKSVTFKDLYFQVEETDQLKSFTIYAIDYASTQTDGNITYYEVSLVANTNNLAKNIEDFHNSLKG